MKELIGKIIKDVKLHDDKESITFITNEGDLVYDAQADCCSHTWIEHIDNPTDWLIGNEVIEVIEYESHELEHEDHECLQQYKTGLKTDKGIFDIEYRNSSNGYYGGSLELQGHYASQES